MVSISRALISVSDKSGIVDFARALAERGIKIVSTGGTAAALREAGLTVADVSDVTGFPEILDGRVKTLHPAVHAGILARRDHPGDLETLAGRAIDPIDLVVVNLYPFHETLTGFQAGDRDFADCIENIDIGGPTLLRAAAKNHRHVTVVVEPDDYRTVLDSLDDNAGPTPELRRRLAADAFAHVAAYDAAVADWLAREAGETAPRRLSLAGRRIEILRYGENPHQQAALYAWDTASQQPGVATARCVQGKTLSYNNINDASAAFALASEFTESACVIVKHANPCGVACHENLTEAFLRARACDPISAFGGVIAFNRPLDDATSTAIAAMFAEVVIAPEISNGARAALAEKTNLRLLETGGMPGPATDNLTLKTVSGGFLAQSADHGMVSHDDLRTVTRRAPSDAEMADLMIAWKVCKHVASNAIVYVKDGATVGIGAGQMSRVDSSRIAAKKAEETAKNAGESNSRTTGSVVASDAFFPFSDGLLAAAGAGATAVIQPGGSKRDDAVITAADEAGLAMVFTGMRHFRH